MSGFFLLKRSVLNASVRNLSAIGFKILVDLFASSPTSLRFKELPYQFRVRQAGESKLDSQAAWDYMMLLADKTIGRYIPVRFLSFSIIGSLGLVAHLLTVGILFEGFALSFIVSQAVATFIAMIGNFSLNNVITYRDRRLRGWKWLKGLTTFVIACSIGAVANVGVAGYLFGRQTSWIPAALAGVVVGSVWNYAVTAVYTWNRPRS